MQYRQGDVFVEKVKALPKSARLVDRKDKRIVLAYGEATGHAHAIHESFVELYEDDNGIYWLRIPEGKNLATLVHEEHDTINLKPGIWRVNRQREYSPDKIRVVYD